jgi:hypothetical protein
MAAPKDPAEHQLVVKAITCNVGGCCEWDEKAARRVRSQPPWPGLTPEGIKELLIDGVANQGVEVIQVEEKRDDYKDRPFYYKAIVPVKELRHGLFVEFVLDDDDPELPVVRIVNAHEQNR